MLISKISEQSTRFIGRQHEVSDIIRLLDAPDCRLLTLTGQGGIGKTRLSLEVARLFDQQNDRFPDGIYFVPLASVTSADNIPLAITNALDIRLNDTVALDKQLINYLRDRHILLVLDNFEHVTEGATFVSNLLDVAEHNTLLVTSRERLHLTHERVYSLQGLTMPQTDQIKNVEEFDALLLFQQIAEKVDWRFKITDNVKSSVIHICQLVDGMPLAIELAAAWVRVLSCATIQQELERSFELLGDSLTHVPERHRSLRIVFEYSWNLLTEKERNIFQSLAIFRGGFTREAIEQIAGATINSLLSLVDKSLIQHDANDRFWIHEQLRQFAEEKLNQNPDNAQKIRDQHGLFYAKFLEQFSSDFVVYDYGLPALDMIKTDLDNIYLMWDWAVTDNHIDAINIASDSLYHYYRMGDAWLEGKITFQKAITIVDAPPDSPEQQRLLAKLLGMVSLFTCFCGLRELTDTQARKGIDIARTFGMIIEEARCLTALGTNAFEKGNYSEARPYLENSTKLYANLDKTYEIQFVWLRLGWVYHCLEQYELARESYLQVVPTDKQYKADGQIAWALTYLGALDNHLGKYATGQQHCKKAVELFERSGGLVGLFAASSNLADGYRGLGQYDKARHYFRMALTAYVNHGSKTNGLAMQTLIRIAHLSALEGDVTRAVELISFVEQRPYVWDETRAYASKLLAELEAELPSIIFQSAQERGVNFELKALVAMLIKEFSTDSEDDYTSQTQAISEQELAILQQVTDSLASGSLLNENLSESERQHVDTLMVTVDNLLEREKAKMMATFMESASHDLRTPLTIINTSLYLLDMISDPEKQKGRLKLIKEQVSHLQNLIENLIVMARLDSGYNFDFQSFDLNQLITLIQETQLKKLTVNRDLDVCVTIPDTPIMIVADSENLELALLNIIKNAVCYTPDGGTITISVRYDTEINQVVFEVKDTGIGIAEKDLPFIFDRFFRVDDARTERGRAGLGLAIAKKIIDAHHGQIEIESILNQGSTFRIYWS